MYEDLFKTLFRIFPLSDLDIIIGNYLVEKAKISDQAKEEEDMSREFNVKF